MGKNRLPIFKVLVFILGISFSIFVWGQERRKADSVIYTIEHLLPVSKARGNWKEVSEYYKEIAKVHALKGQYEYAYQCQLLFAGINDSLFRAETEEISSSKLLEQTRAKRVQRNLLLTAIITFILLLVVA